MQHFNFFKIRPFILILIFIFSSCGSHSQSKIKGNREVRVEKTSISDFNTLSIGNELEVVLIKSNNPSVTIEADENLHSAILFNVNDSILNFQVTKRVKRSKEFKVIIRYTDLLNSIILNGNVSLETENAILLSKLDLTLNDDAKIETKIVSDKFHLMNNNDTGMQISTNCKLNIESTDAVLEITNKSNNNIEINSENLGIYMNEKADLNIEGFAYNLDLQAANSTTLKGKDLLTNIAKIKITDKADVELQVTDSIHIDATGKSKLSLYGEPKVIIDNLTNKATIDKKEF